MIFRLANESLHLGKWKERISQESFGLRTVDEREMMCSLKFRFAVGFYLTVKKICIFVTRSGKKFESQHQNVVPERIFLLAARIGADAAAFELLRRLAKATRLQISFNLYRSCQYGVAENP